MDLIENLFRGLVTLSILAVLQHSCSVKDMAGKAADAHKKGLTSYGAYSKALTGNQESWAK